MTEPLGLSGLHNFGNTCYINSTLQCLSNTEKLTKYFLNKSFTKNTLVNEFQKIINGIHEENCVISPTSFFKTLNKISEKDKLEINFMEQNDMHEFIIFLMDQLHNNLKRKVNISISGKIINENDKIAYESMKQWKQEYENNYSKIINLFYGQIVSIIKVKNKNIESLNYSSLNIFSLPLDTEKDNSTIYDSFNLFTKKHKLEGDNQWKYENDGNYYDATQHIQIWKFPDILILHLKRFNNEGYKINKMVEFPLYNLDLQKYCNGYNSEESIFDLYAICNHIGIPNMGHYFSYCKNFNNNKWYNFDDNSISEMDEDDIKTENAYCLFYKKK
jgi:ubiquitin C-terminal hydrolase